MGKSTINGPCSIAMLNYQRVLDGSSQQLKYNSRKFIGVRGNVQEEKLRSFVNQSGISEPPPSTDLRWTTVKKNPRDQYGKVHSPSWCIPRIGSGSFSHGEILEIVGSKTMGCSPRCLGCTPKRQTSPKMVLQSPEISWIHSIS